MANIPRLVGAPDFGKLVAPEESLGKRLEGKRVLLTGTTKGVGRVTQELLCAQGAFVCGSGRSKGVAAEVANELVAKGYKAAGFDVDLSDYEAVKKWVADCAELMGGIDIVINNASHPGMAPFGEMTPDIWAYGIQNELDLVYNVCNCAWPYLIEAGGGSIIITSSTVGLQGSPRPAMRPPRAHAWLWPVSSLPRAVLSASAAIPSPPVWCGPRPCPTSPRRWPRASLQPRPPSRLSIRSISLTPICSWPLTSPVSSRRSTCRLTAAALVR